MAHLALSVLGSLQIDLDDVPVTSLESDKVRALLAYLAVEADHPHRRETLVGLLWPDCPDPTARHNLRQALFNLRRALGDPTARPPYLLISRDAIQFNRDSDYSLDLARFSELYAAWERDRNRGVADTPALGARLEEMARLYRGDFLQQFSLGDSAEFEEWLLARREALHQRVMAALTHLADDYERRGDFHTARRYAVRQLELDPWREEAHGQIMRVLALDGQRSAALAQYVACRRVLAEELGIEPAAATRDLYEQIRLGTLRHRDEPPSQIPSAPIRPLPVPLTPFLGREPELAELGRLIADPQCRLLTLVGPGGIGKTRLALETAEWQDSEFAQGTAFVPLASVATVDAVVPTIASAIRFAFYGPSDPKAQLLHYLQDKQMLLILDNVEHLLAEGPHGGTIAEILIEILQQAAGVKLLVTSREALNLQEEWLFEVQGLACPGVEQTDGVDDYGAVALFLQRARRARPGLVMNAGDKAGVVRLCRLVEGMPLALELAATWVRILSPSEIATEIERGLDILNTSVRDLPERHRSMRAVFDHSWQMLSPEEKQALGRLSVFQGGFTRRTAEHVAGASLSVLASLVTRSLLRRPAAGRYDLHELIRQYAASKLAEDSRELRAAQERHSIYFLGWLEEKDAKLKGNHQKEAAAELTGEMDNIRAAWDRAVAHHDGERLCRVSITLWYLFVLPTWFVEGEMVFRNAAEILERRAQESEPGEAALEIALHLMHAHSAYFGFRLGRIEAAYAALALSAIHVRGSTDPYASSVVAWYLGLVCWALGRYSEANEYLQESLAKSRAHGKLWYEAMDLEWIGIVDHEQGADERARSYLAEALRACRMLGDVLMTAHVLHSLSRTAQALGEYCEAESLLKESLFLAREVDYRAGAAAALDGLGRVAQAKGNRDEASALFSEGCALFKQIGEVRGQARVLTHQGLNLLALGDTAGAKESFCAALRLAYECGSSPVTLDALAGLAALYANDEACDQTLELVSMVLEHPASTQDAKNIATRVSAQLQPHLPPEQIEAAQQRAGSASLDELVRQVLAST